VNVPHPHITDVHELTTLSALLRHAPLEDGLVAQFCTHERDFIYTFDERIARTLDSTRGVSIFQEQMNEIAEHLFDFTPIQANELRRALLRRDSETNRNLQVLACENAVAERGVTDVLFYFFEKRILCLLSRAAACAHAKSAWELAYVRNRI